MKLTISILALLLSIAFQSQQYDFEKKWKEVNELMDENQDYKKLLPLLDELKIQAKKDNNNAYYVSSLFLINTIKGRTEESDEYNDWQVSVLNSLIKEEKETTGASKYWLLLYNAQFLQSYLQQNRYYLYNNENSALLENKEENIATWSTEKFQAEIKQKYEALISNKKDIQKLDILKFPYLFSIIRNPEFTPSLYQYSISKYISFLNNYNNWDSDEESKKKHENTLSLLDEVLAYNKKNKLYDSYAYFSEIKADKENNDLSSLLEDPIVQKSDYLIGLYFKIAEKDRNSEEKDKAYEYCTQALTLASEDNKWRPLVENLQLDIEVKYASIKMENVSYPNQSIPIVVEHYATENLYLRIYDISNRTTQDSIDDNYRTYLKNHRLEIDKPLIRAVQIPIQKFDDFKKHSSYYTLEGLDEGEYVYFISNREDFVRRDTLRDFISSQNFLVGPYSLTATLVDFSEKEDRDVFHYKMQLLDSDTGLPIKNKKIKQYIYKNDNLKTYSQTTNELGQFDFKYDDYSFYTDITDFRFSLEGSTMIYDAENFDLEELYIYKSREDKNSKKAGLFLDRSIYRPGQKVYFKTIVYNYNKDKGEVAPNTKLICILKNANYEEIGKLELTTNEYGSAAGEFEIPNSGALGNYTLLVNSSSNKLIQNQYFKVEEYKRPKFELEFNEVKENFSLSDSVKVTGFANSFAGTNITNAQVSYRVTRRSIYPFPIWKQGRCFYPYFNVPVAEVANGETETNAEGAFEITFFPTSPEKVDEKMKDYPKTYSFTVYVDVTDINGETHSKNFVVNVGEIPKKLSLHIPSTIPSSKLKEIFINSTNLNNQPTAAKGEFKIYQLKDPIDHVVARKFNEDTNYELIEMEKLQKQFPFTYFGEYSSLENYSIDKEIYQSSFDNAEYSKSDTLWGKYSIPTLKKGYYLIVAEELYKQDSIRDFAYFTVLDDDTYSAHGHNFITYKLDKEQYKVGETATVSFYTNLSEGTVYYYVKSENHSNKLESLQFLNGKASLSIPITEEMKYGLKINYYMYQKLGMQKGEIKVSVLKEMPSLEITTKVFRDKIRPGEKEKWVIHISGKDKDKVSAELLAGMYDSSLDKISYHSWYLYSPNYFANLNLPISYFRNTKKKSRMLNYQNYNSIRYSFSPPILYSSPIYYKFSYIENDKDINSALRGRKPGVNIRGAASMKKASADDDGIVDLVNQGVMIEDSVEKSESLFTTERISNNNSDALQNFDDVKIRKNLEETAFFFPQLRTDSNGDVLLEFTSPEALSNWKLMLLSHTKDMTVGRKELYTKTQKELMVIPNPPRFLRQGDKISFSAKISSLAEVELSGQCTLQLFDASNMQPIDALFQNENNVQEFSVKAGGNTAAIWQLKVPETVDAIVYRVIAKTENFSDGEENSLPVLSNRILLTETLPISIREGQSKTFELKRLSQATSKTLSPHQFTFELDTNPSWMAIFALPYLMDFPYECSEQLFNRYYANRIAESILKQQPQLQTVLDLYASKEISTSPLMQNESLKNIALESTPWLQDALSEEEQMKNLAAHFQSGKLESNLKKTQKALWQRQLNNGGFSWFNNGKASTYISEYILAGLGKMKKLQNQKIIEKDKNNIQKLINFCDNDMIDRIEKAEKSKEKYTPNAFNYLYSRSFWLEEYPLPKEIEKNIEALLSKAEVDYDFTNLQEQAQYAVVLERFKHHDKALQRLHFLQETAVESEENGMYWKSNTTGFSWYQKPIETQSIIIEAYNEILPERLDILENLKVWLIGQKKNQHWETSKSTSDAIYALLHTGKSWANSNAGVSIESHFTLPEDELAKSGMIKTTLKSEDIQAEDGKVSIQKSSPGVAFGGMYFQYFENLENIESAASGLTISKELYLKTITENGPRLTKIEESNSIKIGDKVTVRIILASSQDVEFIHLKDMRASGFEPGNVLSQYYYKNGLAYYINSRDAATHFFFDFIQKGTYVLEYEVIANNAGVFSNGISTLQSMYAPELSAQSNSITIEIKEN